MALFDFQKRMGSMFGRSARTFTELPRSGPGRSMLESRMGKSFALGLAGTSLMARGALGLTHMGQNAMAGLYPRSAYPLSFGQYGFRTAAEAGPAGIAGLKFQFRRR